MRIRTIRFAENRNQSIFLQIVESIYFTSLKQLYVSSARLLPVSSQSKKKCSTKQIVKSEFQGFEPCSSILEGKHCVFCLIST